MPDQFNVTLNPTQSITALKKADSTARVSVRSNRSIVTKPNKEKTVLVNQADILNYVNTLEGLLDVNAAAKTDGSLLIYDEATEKFITSTLLEKQTVNGGHF